MTAGDVNVTRKRKMKKISAVNGRETQKGGGELGGKGVTGKKELAQGKNGGKSAIE